LFSGGYRNHWNELVPTGVHGNSVPLANTKRTQGEPGFDNRSQVSRFDLEHETLPRYKHVNSTKPHGRGAPGLRVGVGAEVNLAYAELALELQKAPDRARARIAQKFFEAGRRMDRLAELLGIGRTTLYRLKNADPQLTKLLSDVARPSRRKEPARASRKKPKQSRRTGT
jgi:hypothetical protein